MDAISHNITALHLSAINMTTSNIFMFKCCKSIHTQTHLQEEKGSSAALNVSILANQAQLNPAGPLQALVQKTRSHGAQRVVGYLQTQQVGSTDPIVQNGTETEFQ